MKKRDRHKAKKRHSKTAWRMLPSEDLVWRPSVSWPAASVRSLTRKQAIKRMGTEMRAMIRWTQGASRTVKSLLMMRGQKMPPTEEPERAMPRARPLLWLNHSEMAPVAG
jgi:uncharacterized protein YfaP (DUF2135 family)